METIAQPFRELTPRQIRFAETYIETRGNGPEAAIQAYNYSSRNSARVIVHRNLHNPKVQAYLEELLRNGAAEKVFESLLQHLQAERPVVVNGELTNIPDDAAQFRAIETITKILGV